MIALQLALLLVAEPSPPPRVLLRTSAGDLIVALDPQAAPQTAAQFAHLVSLGLYDSTRFLRVERGLLVQVGVVESRKQPLSDAQRAAVMPLPLEASPLLPHHRGALSLARDDRQPDSGESSFAILLADAPAFDGQYTVFAHVERGLEVADAIGEAEVDFGHTPLDPVELTQARLLDAGESPSLRPPVAPHHRAGAPPHVPWFIGAMTLLVLGAVLCIQRGHTRLAAALCVLAAFVGFFVVFTLVLPLASHSRLLSLALLVGLVLSFRLVSGFEKPR